MYSKLAEIFGKKNSQVFYTPGVISFTVNTKLNVKENFKTYI